MNNSNQKINREIAIMLCEEIRAENKNKKISFLKLFCRACKGRCIFADEFNRGCRWVNKRYENLNES